MMTLPILKSSALALCACLSVGCGAEGGSPPATPGPIATPSPTPSPTPTPPPTSVTPSIPRLAPGPHLGMITGFEMLNQQRSDAAELRYSQARASGASIGRVQIDWSELEPQEGQYDAQALEDAFADPALEGMNVFILVSTLDTEGLTLPAYLAEPSGLRDGLTLASPEVRDAFANFLSWLGPQLVGRNVWGLSLGNEVDAPVGDGIVDEANAITFFQTGLAQWNRDYPEVAVGVTLTSGALKSGSNLQTALRDASDLVSVNYYCLNSDLTVTDQSRWEADVAGIKSAAGNREIFFQELGCPVGYSPQSLPTSIGGSLERQVQFFEYFGNAFATDPQLRAATMFQLFDFSPELAASFAQPLRDEGATLAADRLEEWIATSGFLRWSDSFERPAWQAWLNQLEQVRAAR